MPQNEGMQATTVRFGRAAYEVLRREAQLDGTSISLYVRESALARAVFSMALRVGDRGELGNALQTVREDLDELGIDGMTFLERIVAAIDDAVVARRNREM